MASPQHGANVNSSGKCVAHLPDDRHCVAMFTFNTPCLNRNNLTPLHVSVSKNNKNIVQLLLQHGADVNAINKCDQSFAAVGVEESVHIYAVSDGVERRCMPQL